MSSRDSLLARLPPAASKAMTKLFARGAKATPIHRRDALAAAFTAVGFPDRAAGISPSSTLTDAQRALAELVLDVPNKPVAAWAIPTENWNLRRWLGLDPPGALETITNKQPLWLRLRERMQLAKLPFPERLAVFVELGAGGYLLDTNPDLELLGTPAEIEKHAATAAAIAPVLADWLLGLREPRFIPTSVALGLFATLALGGVAIEPRWEPLFLVHRNDATHAALVKRCADAIPPRPTAPPRPSYGPLVLRARRRPAKPTKLLRAQLADVIGSAELYRNTELFDVLDATNTHRYDMYLTSGDDGRVFETGTTDEVAIFAQGGADASDESLREELDAALARSAAE